MPGIDEMNLGTIKVVLEGLRSRYCEERIVLPQTINVRGWCFLM